jgi:hypothetical protein
MISLTEKFFQYIGLWNLGPGRGQILPFDRFVNFVPMDRYMPRRIDSDFYVTAPNAENRDLDLVPDYKTLIFFSCKD